MISAILKVLSEHGPNATFRIANLLALGNPRIITSTRKVRFELLRLEAKGKVSRHHGSTVNNTIWMLKP